MSLVAVSGVMETIAKAGAVDEPAAKELLRHTLYDALCTEVDRCRDQLELDFSETVDIRSNVAKRALVRAYVDRRLSNEDVSDLLDTAAYLSAVQKAGITEDNPNTNFWDRRLLGQFIARGNKAVRDTAPGGSALDAVGAFAVNPESGSKVKGFADSNRYDKLRTLGQGLTQIDMPGATSVGIAAQVVGNLGKEAEEVLKPSILRSAYRYRGTERRPDSGLRRQLQQADVLMDLRHSNKPLDQARGAAMLGWASDGSLVRREARGQREPSLAIAGKHLANRSLNPDQTELRTSGDIAANYLRTKLPNMEIAALSLASQAVPPSQGVIIDSDGDVVSEAMGIKGDHYLPFDLKNLKGLQGGQYTRTRLSGGPTTEDIYTGLITGARQMQVVSHSGVFTVEFDPNLRGGRRYSDKARQMVGRYEKILDAVNGKGGKDPLYQRDVSPERRSELRAQALEEVGSSGDVQSTYTQLLDSERRAALFSSVSEEEIEDLASTQTNAWAQTQQRGGKAPSSQAMARYREEKVKSISSEMRSDQIKPYQLDGEGYAAALNALQQEFPYFIRSVDFEAMPDFVESRGLYEENEKPPRRRAGKDTTYDNAGNARQITRRSSGSSSRTASVDADVEDADQAATSATEAMANRAVGATSTAVAPVVANAIISMPPRPMKTPLISNIDLLSNPKAVREAAEVLQNTQKFLRQYVDHNGMEWEGDKADRSKRINTAKSDPESFLAWAMSSHGTKSTDIVEGIAKDQEVAGLFVTALEDVMSKDVEFEPANGPVSPPSENDIALLNAVIGGESPWADVDADINSTATLGYVESRPLLFKEINELGTPERFASYAAKGGAAFKAALDKLKDGDQESIIGRAIDDYEAVSSYSGPEDAEGLPEGVGQEEIDREKRGNGIYRKNLQMLHLAWAYQKALPLAGLRGRGPLVQERELETTAKRLEVHPVGSPLADALQGLLRR